MSDQLHGVTTDAAPPAPAKVVAPGTLIAGRYLLEARLGAGGAGTVWRCRDQQLGATVALKIIDSDGDLERWRREVAMARRIADRHVCRVHDLGEAGELRFVTMELVAGASLRSVIDPDLDGARARELFTQIVTGVAAIHAAGIVHRDLKPENIVVGDGRAVIVDFGLAREPTLDAGAPEVTQSGAVVGTPRYMSPEQAIGASVDARTDIWALGLVGHELLTGTRPALVEGALAVSPEVDHRWPGIAAVLRRCLALDPADRFTDARALQAALPARRRRRTALVIGGLALVGAAVGIVALVNPDPIARPEPPAGTGTGTGSGAAALAKLDPVVLEPIGAPQKRWPQDAPLSALLSRDGTRYAVTTIAGELGVRALAGADEPALWPLPRDVVTARAIGWFSDDTIAVLATTREGTYALHRISRTAAPALLHAQGPPFHAAIADDDRVAIGHAEGVWLLAPTGAVRLVPVAAGEQLLALAWSPDGTQLALARARGAAARIDLVATTPGPPREVWTGDARELATVFAWLDEHRLVFTRSATLGIVDVRDKQVVERALAEPLRAGSAAGGTLLVIRETATDSIQVGDAGAEELAPMIANLATGHLAGWIPDGRVVLAAGTPAQIVRAVPGQRHEPWPGTREGDVPAAIVGDHLLVQRVDPAAPIDRRIVIERVDATGRRRELLRLHGERASAAPVRCAGDRAAPCMLHELVGSTATWTELDPETGTRRAVIHSRVVDPRHDRDAALSLDGNLFAVVEGTSGLTILDRATGTTRTYGMAADTVAVALAFAGDDKIWASVLGFRGRLFGLVTFAKSTRGASYFAPTAQGSAYRDALRRFGRVYPSPDGSRVAAAVRELRLQVARVRGL